MAVLRKIVDEKDARACLRAAARSGEERRLWARSHGIDGRSLRAWEIKLAMRSTEGSRRSSPELVELVPASVRGASARFVVRIGDAAIEVGDDFDDTALRRIIEVIRAC